jgi:polygalacturonase
VEGNVFENNWVQAQSGYAILFTVKVGADMPWGAIEDVVVRNNILRNSPHGFNISGRDATGGSMTRVTIANNVIDKVPGRFLQVTNSANNLTVDHNTIANSPGSTVLAFGTTANQGLVLKNNIASRPIRGDSKADGTASLNAYAPGAVVSRNVISGAAATAYPAGNYYPASISAVRFVDEFGGNYTLAADSPYRGLATDGKDIGADIAAVTAATAGAVTPR